MPAVDAMDEKLQANVRPAAQAGAEILYQAVLRNVQALGRKTGNLASSIYQAFSRTTAGPAGDVSRELEREEGAARPPGGVRPHPEIQGVPGQGWPLVHEQEGAAAAAQAGRGAAFVRRAMSHSGQRRRPWKRACWSTSHDVRSRPVHAARDGDAARVPRLRAGEHAASLLHVPADRRRGDEHGRERRAGRAQRHAADHRLVEHARGGLQISRAIEDAMRTTSVFKAARPIAAAVADYDAEIPVYGCRQDFTVWHT
jgi:hypothetical protein